jgi:hypothetical protein
MLTNISASPQRRALIALDRRVTSFSARLKVLLPRVMASPDDLDRGDGM